MLNCYHHSLFQISFSLFFFPFFLLLTFLSSLLDSPCKGAAINPISSSFSYITSTLCGSFTKINALTTSGFAFKNFLSISKALIRGVEMSPWVIPEWWEQRLRGRWWEEGIGYGENREGSEKLEVVVGRWRCRLRGGEGCENRGGEEKVEVKRWRCKERKYATRKTSIR